MPISVVCPTCRALLPVPDDHAGKMVRCAECQAVIRVPEPVLAVAAAGPTRRRPPSEWDADIDDRPAEPRKSAGTGILWSVVGTAGCLMLVCGGIVVGGYRQFEKANAGQQVAAPPAEVPQPLVFDPPPEGGFAPQPDPNIRPARWDQPAPKKMGAATRIGLVGQYRGRTTIDASSEYTGRWAVADAFDGQDGTSWFSNEVALGRQPNPWLRVTFPEDVTVSRVTIKGNREPEYLRGYTVLAGKLELLDAAGKVVHTASGSATFNAPDYAFNVPKVSARAVRFTATKAEVSLTKVAVGEMIIE